MKLRGLKKRKIDVKFAMRNVTRACIIKYAWYKYIGIDVFNEYLGNQLDRYVTCGVDTVTSRTKIDGVRLELPILNTEAEFTDLREKLYKVIFTTENETLYNMPEESFNSGWSEILDNEKWYGATFCMPCLINVCDSYYITGMPIVCVKDGAKITETHYKDTAVHECMHVIQMLSIAIKFSTNFKKYLSGDRSDSATNIVDKYLSPKRRSDYIDEVQAYLLNSISHKTGVRILNLELSCNSYSKILRRFIKRVNKQSSSDVLGILFGDYSERVMTRS